MIEILHALHNVVNMLSPSVISAIIQTCKDANIFQTTLSKLFIEYAKAVCIRNYVINTNLYSPFARYYSFANKETNIYNKCVYTFCRKNNLLTYSSYTNDIANDIAKTGYVYTNTNEYIYKKSIFHVYNRNITNTIIVKKDGRVHNHVYNTNCYCKRCNVILNQKVCAAFYCKHDC